MSYIRKALTIFLKINQALWQFICWLRDLRDAWAWLSLFRPLGLPPTCPWPRTPRQPPGPSGLDPAVLQWGWSPASHSPAQPWALPSWAHPWANIPAEPQLVPVPREVPSTQGWSCPAPGWSGGTALAILPHSAPSSLFLWEQLALTVS